MSTSPIDGIHPEPIPLDRSRLFQVATAITRSRSTASTGNTQDASDQLPHFELSTSQLIRFVRRYSVNTLTFDKLMNIPLSQLSPDEKTFVLFLRRNRQIFDRISRLDQDPTTLSVEDVKRASQLAGDFLTLTDEDLYYLRDTSSPVSQANPQQAANAKPIETPPPPQRPAQPQTKELEALVQKLNVQQNNNLSYTTFMSLRATDARLNKRDTELLDFLKSPTVSKVLERVVEPNNNQITPDIIRILASLLWNPLIYGAAPIVFHKTPEAHHHDADVEQVEEVEEVEAVEDENPYPPETKLQKPHFRLYAHDISAICHKLSADGHVSLAQLRAYQPQTPEEIKALNLLRQSTIFETLANLDHHPESLSDDDIRLAISEGTMVLSDPAMILVILP
jgi:hypothetical protein